MKPVKKSLAVIQPLSLIAIVIFGTLWLILPAIWNGFPLVHTDTLSYLVSGVDLIAPPDRSMFYGLYLRVTTLHISVWGGIICQSVLLVFLLLKLANFLFPTIQPKYLFGWLLLIGLFSSAPWFTGHISPDIFSAILFLAIIMWSFSYKESSYFEVFFLGMVISFSICVHSSNLIISVLITSAMIFWFIIHGVPWKVWKRFLIVMFLSIATSILLILSTNVWSHYGATLNPTGKVFLLARVLEDGPGLKYLKDKCGYIDYKTCAALPKLEHAREIEMSGDVDASPELRNLVASAFLWGGGLADSGGIFAVNEEAGAIIKGAILEYPSEQFVSLLLNLIDQMRYFTVGEQFNSTAKIGPINSFFESQFPSSYKSYLNSQQSNGRVSAITGYLNPIYSFIVIFSALTLVYYLIVRKNHVSTKIPMLVYGLSIFLISNALVTGGLSGVHDRYQSRVVWLLPAIAILILLGSLNLHFNRAIKSNHQNYFKRHN